MTPEIATVGLIAVFWAVLLVIVAMRPMRRKRRPDAPVIDSVRGLRGAERNLQRDRNSR